MLSGSIGMGHDQLAEACSTSLRSDGWSTQTLDLMRLLGRGADSVADGVFRAMLSVPGLYDAFHFAALREGCCPGCATCSTRTRPTSSSRCSRPAHRR
jgi:processive 1,2-diacylglycerol beta-glucosyltransferase